MGHLNAGHMTLEDAKDYCDNAGDCRYVYDIGCDNKEFFTCHKGKLVKYDKPGVSSCVYAKGNPSI